MRALLFLAILTFVFSCKDQPKKAEEAQDVPMSSEELAAQGEQLMSTYCYQCHNPETSEESMLAPPMIGVKTHYMTEGISKEDFVADMLAWMKGPKAENSKMPHALEKFGLMNHQVYPDSVIIGIAEYMYDNEVAQPEWYAKHHEEMHGSEEEGTGQEGQKKGDQ